MNSIYEDKLIAKISELGIFKSVLSAGRKTLPESNIFPVCYVYLARQRRQSSRPRPVFETDFNIIIGNKNLTSEKNVAYDTYELIRQVYECIEGQTFGFTNITPFEVVEISVQDYQYNVIFYELVVRTNIYMQVPVVRG